jgi:hypothetical protein
MLQEMFPDKNLSEISASLDESVGDTDEAVTGLLSPNTATFEGMKETVTAIKE